jgi:hypothetical protein
MKFQYFGGLIGYGVSGTDGSAGLQGMALYFTDYDPNSNFIAIESAIANNEVLWSTAIPGTKLPGGRVYITGDLFISPRGYIYQINADTDDFIKIEDVILNKADFFEFGKTTGDGQFERWSNIYSNSIKYIIDNNKSSENNYLLYPSKIYGIELRDFNRIEYTDNSNGAFTLYSIGENSGTDDHQALALVRDSDGFRIGNLGTIIRNTNLIFDIKLLQIKKEDSNRFHKNTPLGTVLSNSEIAANFLFDPNFVSTPIDFQGSVDVSAITISWNLSSFISEPAIKGDLYFYESSINYLSRAFNLNDVSIAKPVILPDVESTGSVTINNLGIGKFWEYYMLLHKDGWERVSGRVTAIT